MSTVYKDRLYGKIKESLSDKSNLKMIESTIRSYMEKNTSKFTHVGPVEQIIFGDIEKSSLFKAFNVTHEEVYKAMLDSEDTDVKARDQTVNTFNISCSIALQVLRELKEERYFNYLLTLYGLSFYPSTYYKYFRFNPNKAIMEYAVNNMTNRFYIKQKGLYRALIITVEVCHETNSKKLEKGEDKSYIDFILDTKNRYNAFFKNIKDSYEKARESGGYITSETDNMDEENYKETTNSMVEIQRITDRVYMKIAIDGPDQKYLQMASKITETSLSDLRNWLNNVLNEKKEERQVRRLIECILYSYLYDNKASAKTIRSNDFLIKSMAEFKRANSPNKNTKDMKELLDVWLTDYSDIRNKTSRPQTLTQYKRGMYAFFVLTIMTTD